MSEAHPSLILIRDVKVKHQTVSFHSIKFMEKLQGSEGADDSLNSLNDQNKPCLLLFLDLIKHKSHCMH